jgi:hypothetical protein
MSLIQLTHPPEDQRRLPPLGRPPEFENSGLEGMGKLTESTVER